MIFRKEIRFSKKFVAFYINKWFYMISKFNRYLCHLSDDIKHLCERIQSSEITHKLRN